MAQFRRIAEEVEGLGALDAPADALAGWLEPILSPQPWKDLLSGTWLGHPLHPLLTDVVIGCWTGAGFLDVLGGKHGRRAADTLIGLGCLAALPTALAGASDWLDVNKRSRRVGILHAAGNVTGLMLYALSYLQRKRGRRFTGFLLSSLGSGGMVASAFLGGHLSFGMGAGVNQTAFEGDYYEDEPSEWTPALDEATLAKARPGKGRRGRAGSIDVFLYREGDRVHALANRCSHRGCGLHTGKVEGSAVVCPCHGSTFSLEDGSVLRGPATAPQRAYEARVNDGQVEVRVRPESGG